MRKLLKYTAWVVLLAMTVGTVFAQSSHISGGYDPVTEGIVSGYYQIDTQRGYILGVAPGTTPEQLKNVCFPGNLTVSGNVIGTGTVVTATVEIPQPEPTVPETTVPETTVPETTEPEVEETTKPGRPGKPAKPGKEDNETKPTKPEKEDKETKPTKPAKEDKPVKNDRAEEVRNNLDKAAATIRNLVIALINKLF